MYLEILGAVQGGWALIVAIHVFVVMLIIHLIFDPILLKKLFNRVALPLKKKEVINIISGHSAII